MQPKPSHLLLAFFMVLFTLRPAMAAGPAVHISATPAWLTSCKPYDKKVPARSVQNGYFYQLVESQINVEKQAEYRHVITEIVSEAGIQNGSEVTVNFDPSYERLDFHQLRIWRNGKPQDRLSAGAFKMIADEKELSRFIYQGSYSAYCILADIRKGDRIEYAYTVTGRNPIFNNRFSRDLYFGGSQPIAHLYKSLQVAPGHTLHFKSFNKVPQVAASVKNGMQCYEWDAYQLEPVPYDENQPGWYSAYAYVQISDYNSWQEVVNWALKVNPLSVNIKGKLAQQIAQLKAQAGGNKEKYFRSAVKMVQDEVRYMGIEMGEYSHRANTPEKVFNQRYGDCKDKALLLASVLNAGGIDAQMVLVNTSLRNKVDELLPAPNVFDHAVLTANVNGKQVWVDATMAYQRGTGTNIYFPAYGKGLVLKAGNNVLTPIKPAVAGKTVCRETYVIPSESAKVQLDVTTTYTLNEADKIRDRLASAGMAETEKNYLTYYTRTYPEIERVDSITVLDNEEKNELTTVEHYLINGFLKKDSAQASYNVSFFANFINEQLYTIPNATKTPVALNYPCNLEYTIKVVLASGWNIATRREGIKRDAYALETLYHTEGDTLLLNYQFRYLQSYLPANKLNEYRQDIKKMTDDLLSFSITYTPDLSKIPFKLNYWMTALLLTVAGLMTYAGIRIYRTETDGVLFAPGARFKPLGGWLILIALGLAVTPFALLAILINNNFFDLNQWHSMALKGDWSLEALLVFEAVANTFMLCYTVFCFVLFINKRDILPKYITGLYIFVLVFTIADYAVASMIGYGSLDDKGGSAIFRAILGAAIWIPYFQRSARVHSTFIVPYPASNYAYEQPSATAEDPFNNSAEQAEERSS